MNAKQSVKPKRSRSKRKPIHWSIKDRLGYPNEMPDSELLKDWRARLRQVCKPCWELKYCPFGPLVEQSPLLPPEREGTIEYHKKLEKMLETNLLGERAQLTNERRQFLEEWVADREIIELQAQHELYREALDKNISESPDPGEAFEDHFHGALPDIQDYRVPYDQIPSKVDRSNLTSQQRKSLDKKIREIEERHKKALETGIEDNRRPIDEGRSVYFQKQVQSFDPENYPESIPSIFQDGSCNIFGHICPVFFTAEAITETTTERRIGRYIPFAVKMRVVRRDNHTCQHCGKHLADNEVEFDHKIPISKGGSSEEHNVRLTCYDCNREKRDSVEI